MGGQSWTYVTVPHRRAVVHASDCGYCNSGNGIHGGAPTKAGRWVGPSTSRAEARARGLEAWPDNPSDCTNCAGH